MRAPQEQGFALVAVLGLVAVAAALVVAALSLAQSGAASAAGYADAIEGGTAASAGIRLAAIRLADTDGSGLPAGPQRFEWSGWQVTLRIEDEAGKLDINRVSRPRIAQALSVLGHNAQRVPARRFVTVDDLAGALGIPADGVEPMRRTLTVYGGAAPEPTAIRSALETYRIVAEARRGRNLIVRWAIVRLSPGFGTPFEWLERGGV